MRVGRSVRAPLWAALAVAAVLSGCSAPGVFPAILDDPGPRKETTLDPDQIKQATADLISERERLCSEARADRSPHDSAATAKCGPDDASTTGALRPGGGDGRP